LTDAAPGVRLSVVIAAWNGAPSLERCLRSLEDDGKDPATEVIAVTNFDSGVKSMLEAQFSYVRHNPMARGTPVPALRAAGIYLSRGEIVALGEDHCTFGKGWCSAITKAHELPYGAIGGVVENASVDRALDWAVYFYDYGKFMPPVAAGVVGSLSGNNVSIKRTVLAEVETNFRDGYFEPFTHGAILERGHQLYLFPTAVVYHHKTYRTGYAAAHCYHLARSYAAKRVRNASGAERWKLTLGSAALPLLLTGRVVASTLRKGRHIAALLRSLPHLLLLMTSWSWGEFCGYAAGEGRSAAEWK
jgi:GT2 family glycosyltransferase